MVEKGTLGIGNAKHIASAPGRPLVDEKAAVAECHDARDHQKKDARSAATGTLSLLALGGMLRLLPLDGFSLRMVALRLHLLFRIGL